MESGGPDGELGASLRYLSQRNTMLTPQAVATLNDIGTEELGHLEMIGAICYQLTENATPLQMQAAGLDADYVDHGLGIYPQAASGVPWTAAGIQSKGDPITDLYEDMAADVKVKKHNWIFYFPQKFQWIMTGCSLVIRLFLPISI